MIVCTIRSLYFITNENLMLYVDVVTFEGLVDDVLDFFLDYFYGCDFGFIHSLVDGGNLDGGNGCVTM